MRELLDGLDRVMDATCADEPAVIVGNSMGAWLGFLYARNHPDRVARLVAVNGGPLFEPNPRVNLFPTNRDEARETMRGLMGPASPPIPGYVLDDIVRRTAGGPAARFAQTAGEMGAYLLDGRLDEVTVPVELVWGAADQLLTLDYAQRLVDGLPRARLHPINGCGHVPQRECPIRFLEALDAALSEPPPPAVPEGGADAGETPLPQEAVGIRRDGEPPYRGGDQQAGSLLHNRSGSLFGPHPACRPNSQQTAASLGVTGGWA
jgi:pimeloyl-ACP methyl ester carboxylesterase